jgi:hypothetical protein
MEISDCWWESKKTKKSVRIHKTGGTREQQLFG